METISLGGRRVSGFSLAAGFDGEKAKLQDALNSLKDLDLSKIDLGKRETGGVFMPAWIAGASAGSTVALLANRFKAPHCITAVAGVGTTIGVWAALR